MLTVKNTQVIIKMPRLEKDMKADDVLEKELKKSAFRMLVQRKSVFRKLELDAASTNDIAIADNLKNIFKCGYCCGEFSDEGILISHLLTHDSRPYRPIKLNTHNHLDRLIKGKVKLKNKNITGALKSAKSREKFKRCDVCLPKTKKNKLISTASLLNIETCDLKRTGCNEQNVRTSLLNSSCTITEKQENEDNEKSAEQTLQSYPVNTSIQSYREVTETPRLAMASVGKRKSKKRLYDDFIRYELSIKKTKRKSRLTENTKTDSEVVIKQKTIKSKSTSKKSTKNNRKKRISNTELGVSVENISFVNEKNNGNNFTISSTKIAQKEIKSANIKNQRAINCNVHNEPHHQHNCSASENTMETHSDITNISIGSRDSKSILTSRKVEPRTIRSATFLRCVVCKGCYLWKLPFLDHMKVHPNERPFECISCHKRFLSFFCYITHMRNLHNPVKAHCCRKCKRRYSSWYMLKLHVISHTNCSSFNYLCSLCGKSFPYKYILSGHLVSEHLKTAKESPSCKPCGKSFKDRRNLWIHQRRHPNAVKPYKCNFCHRKFTMHKWLIEHVRRHSPERNYPCRLCGKCYFTKSDATMHERRHTKEATFACSECHKRFIYRSELNAHIKRHQGIRLPKNIVCDVCNKAFSTRRDLERHVMVHTGEKPFKCHICSKRFSQEVNMQVHVKIHSGDRPYQCDLCDKRFIAKSKLSRHMRCHTTSKGMLPRPFKCILCPKKYTAENSLIRHLRTHRDSVEIITNIKTALNKAVEESSTAQPPACAGAVLACMIDQAILDARRIARFSKNHRPTGDQSLAEIIDQAVHDSKTTSSTQTPIVIENFNNTYVDMPPLSPSSTSKKTEAVTENISGPSPDLSTNFCSDLAKVMSDALGEHVETIQEYDTKKSTLYPNSSTNKPLTEAIIVKPKGSILKCGSFVRITKHDNNNLLLTDQEVITSDPSRSLLEPVTVPHDITSHNQAMKISLGSSNNQHICLTHALSSSPNKILVVPISGLGPSQSEQQVILLDTLSDQSHMLLSAPPDSNSTFQQNILSINGKSTLFMIPSSQDKHLSITSLHSSANHVQEFVLPRDVTGVTKRDHFVLIPSDASTRGHRTSLKPASLSKMEHILLETSGRHMLTITSLDESSHLPVSEDNSIPL